MSTPLSILSSRFGFDQFRPGQKDVIESILARENVLAVMPTGAGKSLCYQVPALMLDRPTIVVSPLVALMDNQVAGLRENGIPAACLHSGQDREENIAQWRLVTNGTAKILYMAPERLMTGRMLSAMKALDPALFVIDEAHCVSKWGPSFRPEYADLSRLKDMFPDSRIAAFTATADALTQKDIADQLFDGQGRLFVHGFDRPNLSLNVAPVSNRRGQLLDFMSDKHGQSGIVYCLSRKNTEKYAAVLNDAGFTALPYHAGMDAATRFDHQERFMAEPGIVMVATIAFGMGIDKPDIRYVFHTNLPGSVENYYQEIGRAGRDGEPAVTSLLYGWDDIRMRREFIEDDGEDTAHKIREHKRLDALIGYCEATKCRRQILLQYFGEDSAPCGNCDNCENPPRLVDATEPLKHILAAVEQSGERFGPAHIINIVRGEANDRIRQFGHNQCPAFGAGENLAKPYVQALVRQAVTNNVLTMDLQRYGVLGLTPKARDIMSGAARFECRDFTQRGKAGAKTVRKKALSVTLSEEDEALLLDLKALRAELARKIAKPAYVIFSDATLLAMVSHKPSNKSELLEISGVGEVKYQRYGEAFLAALSPPG